MKACCKNAGEHIHSIKRALAYWWAMVSTCQSSLAPCWLHAVQLCYECAGADKCPAEQTRDQISTSKHLMTTEGSRFKCAGFHVNLHLEAIESTVDIAAEQIYATF